MDYSTVKETADRWKITARRVSALCSEGRISGAVMFGNQWAIPSDLVKPDDLRTRLDFVSSNAAKPFIKWAGGKGQLLPEIRRSYPSGFGIDVCKYAEPFVGGGAVLFDVLNHFDLDEVYISDINRELIGTYKTIRDNPEELIGLLSSYQCDFNNMDLDERKDYYKKKREHFNELKIKGNGDVTVCSSLFIFLNKTCFNGLYRVNSKGQFNVPLGSYKNPMICDTENIRAASIKLQDVSIREADYTESGSFIDDRTFVYFDPPYRPLNQSSSFTSYTEQSFNDEDQKKLADYVISLVSRGAYVAVSNSDPKNTNPNDNFFDDLYSDCIINRVQATRMINSKAENRGKISELLITNYPIKGEVTIDSFM